MFHRGDDCTQPTGIDENHSTQVKQDFFRRVFCYLAHIFLELERNGCVDPVVQDSDNLQ